VIDLILANTASIPAGSVPKISITPSSVIGSSLQLLVPVVFVILESLFHQVDQAPINALGILLVMIFERKL
jgi:hypothetical protein